MEIKKILVTGSSGTIGTRLCEKLIEKGYEITGVDWNPNKWNKKVNEKTVLVDLRDKEKVEEKLPKDVDLIIHLAANARVYNLTVDPSMAKDNFETAFNALEFARKNEIKRFMFASSREAYGNSEKTVHKEDEVKIELCESPYSASKLAGEALVQAYNKCYGTEFVIFRFSNVYGMYDESDRVVPLFIRLCKEGKDLVVFGKEKLLDFTYIDDTVNGIIKSIEKFEEIKNDTYNLANGNGTKILDVAEQIKSRLNRNVAIKIDENRRGEVVKYIADITKAREKIGFEPKIQVEEGIERTIEWYEKNVY